MKVYAKKYEFQIVFDEVCTDNIKFYFFINNL